MLDRRFYVTESNLIKVTRSSMSRSSCPWASRPTTCSLSSTNSIDGRLDPLRFWQTRSSGLRTLQLFKSYATCPVCSTTARMDLGSLWMHSRLWRCWSSNLKWSDGSMSCLSCHPSCFQRSLYLCGRGTAGVCTCWKSQGSNRTLIFMLSRIRSLNQLLGKLYREITRTDGCRPGMAELRKLGLNLRDTFGLCRII